MEQNLVKALQQDAHSGAFGHLFHKHSATHSGNIRPPIPEHSATPLRSGATHRFAA